jgi:deoxyribodipyrimidine photo-lyase
MTDTPAYNLQNGPRPRQPTKLDIGGGSMQGDMVSAGGAAVVWLRDDLRLADNPALHAAVSSGRPVLVCFILADSPRVRRLGGAARWWLHHSLAALSADLAERGIPLVLRRGEPVEEICSVAAAAAAGAVYWNRRYARDDRAIDDDAAAALRRAGIVVETRNGHLLAEPGEVRTKAGEWFRVFTPFWKAARSVVDDLSAPHPAPRSVMPAVATPGLSLDELELLPTRPDWAGGLRQTWRPGEAGARARLATFLDERLAGYAAGRDVPAAEVTSELSPHIRFGEISVRTIWHAARHHAMANRIPEEVLSKFLAELGWREFSYHLLFHFPDLGERNFQGRFDGFPWRRPDPAVLRAWQRGKTGYPIVDAGMRQLWTTGWMHNRVRMIVASFLVKHLLIDWRVGEDWFWDTLCDADPANNAAGWQWVAGSGADAAPFFRVFNPVLQGAKFDPDGAYVRRWIPELADVSVDRLHTPWLENRDLLKNRGGGGQRTYPEPIVDHQNARDRALAAFERIKTYA